MLSNVQWKITSPYPDRETSVLQEQGNLSVTLSDTRYSVVRAEFLLSDIRPRWYYRLSFDFSAEGLQWRLFVTFRDAAGKELSKLHLLPNDRVLSPEGSFDAVVEVLCMGKNGGSFILNSFAISADAPYTNRFVNVCSIACDMNNPQLLTMDMQEGLAFHLSLIDQVASLKPDVVVLTEAVLQTLQTPKTSVQLDGPELEAMCQKAREHNCYIACSLRIEREHGVVSNSGILIDRQGNLQAVYGKTHLTIGEMEMGMELVEEPLAVFDTDFGRVGMLICWEHFFPEQVRRLALAGAEMLLIPTHGFRLDRAVTRALDNGVYVVTSHVRGTDSIIAGPDGKVVDTGADKGYAFARIDLNEPKPIFWLSYPAQMIPGNVYSHERRPELYADLAREQNSLNS